MMITYFLIGILMLTASFLYYRRVQLKLKNYIYNISSFIHENKTRYYIVYEQQHGSFASLKELPILQNLLVPSELKSFVNQNFHSEDEAFNALRTFKRGIRE